MSAGRSRSAGPPSHPTFSPPSMPLPLDRTLKREVVVDGAPYTVTVSPYGVKLVRKGFRKGRAVSWRALLAGGRPEADASSDAAGDAAGDDDDPERPDGD